MLHFLQIKTKRREILRVAISFVIIQKYESLFKINFTIEIVIL